MKRGIGRRILQSTLTCWMRLDGTQGILARDAAKNRFAALVHAPSVLCSTNQPQGLTSQRPHGA